METDFAHDCGVNWRDQEGVEWLVLSVWEEGRKA
jgi:hypothetical protein